MKLNFNYGFRIPFVSQERKAKESESKKKGQVALVFFFFFLTVYTDGAIYVVICGKKKKKFILTVSFISNFHLSLNSCDHVDNIPKY